MKRQREACGQLEQIGVEVVGCRAWAHPRCGSGHCAHHHEAKCAGKCEAPERDEVSVTDGSWLRQRIADLRTYCIAMGLMLSLGVTGNTIANWYSHETALENVHSVRCPFDVFNNSGDRILHVPCSDVGMVQPVLDLSPSSMVDLVDRHLADSILTDAGGGSVTAIDGTRYMPPPQPSDLWVHCAKPYYDVYGMKLGCDDVFFDGSPKAVSTKYTPPPEPKHCPIEYINDKGLVMCATPDGGSPPNFDPVWRREAESQSGDFEDVVGHAIWAKPIRVYGGP